jgi:hypothetical protein
MHVVWCWPLQNHACHYSASPMQLNACDSGIIIYFFWHLIIHVNIFSYKLDKI